MKRSLTFAAGCTVVVLGASFSYYLSTLENRPQIGVVAFCLAAVTLFPGFFLIGRSIWAHEH